jgi:hypothetical protein
MVNRLFTTPQLNRLWGKYYKWKYGRSYHVENGGVGSGIKGHRTPRKDGNVESKKDDGNNDNVKYDKKRIDKDITKDIADYYQKHYQGTSIKKEPINEIKFTGKGRHELRKLPHNVMIKKELIPHLREMINKSKIIELKKGLTHIRKDDIQNFSRFKTKMKGHDVEILTGESKKDGNLFYDYFVDKDKK